MGIPKIKTATALRENLYETLKNVAQGGSPCVITHRQGDNIVLLSQKDYNKMLEEHELLKSIAAGVADIDAGRILSHDAAVAQFDSLKEEWK